MPGPRIPQRILLLLPLILVWWAFLNPLPPDSMAAPPPDKTEAQPPALKVPPGFIVERVAGPPQVEHPMMACFDERGRLFLAESAGKNLKAEELLKNPPNFIRLLEDTKGNGHFDRSTLFADKMTFPQGVLWHDGALYTASPPHLWRLEEKDGKVSKRQELVTKFGFTGNAADIHGPFLGPDGRLYWCDGRHGHQIKQPDGSLLKGKAARIFRCRPDGSDVEVVCGGGMDNPVEAVFTPEGEALATVDILVARPRRNDAIIYAIEGGVYPYHEVYKEFKQTGGLLPPVGFLGWVAPSGLLRYRGTALGAQYQGNLFSAQFNRHRIQRHILQREGANFSMQTEDFLTSTDPNFHPTDVLEDADGSLLVVDTGGWFRIGCPTSQIARPEIKGAIYRVRRADAPKPNDPRGLSLPWEKMTPGDLAKLLDDPRFSVRDRAVALLAQQGQKSLAVLGKVREKSPSVRARRNAVWALTRIGDKEALALLRSALKDKDVSVRLAATHALGLLRDDASLDALLKLVAKDTPALRRNAATALGRIGRAEAVPALLESVQTAGDRFLEHALIYALIRIADRKATLKGLDAPQPVVRRAALIALDQMTGGDLTRELVTPFLSSTDSALQQTALDIITARPAWAKELVGLLRQWLGENNLDAARQESVRGAIVALCKDKAIQELVAQTLQQKKTSAALRLLLLETISRAPLDKLPPAWVQAMGDSLRHSDENVVRQAVATLRSTAVADFDAVLLELARDKKRPADLRIAALAAGVARMKHLEEGEFLFLTQQLDPTVSPLLRLAAAEALGRAPLDGAQRETLTGAVAATGALELPLLLPAYEHSKNVSVGKKLLAALEKSPGLTSLSPEGLRRTLRNYPASLVQAAAPLLKRLEADSAKQKAHLDELEATLPAGDAEQGRLVFFGKKAACFTCHAIGTEGGRIGPDLSKIGGIRSGRDLLESIVFPSASFARGYEPYLIETKDGRLFNGIVARETAEAIYLQTTERAEIRIPRKTVATIERSRVSIMPQGLDAQLSKQELGDLLAFLKSLK
jgi:putative membrane-bound dehydrogenase-like protein